MFIGFYLSICIEDPLRQVSHVSGGALQSDWQNTLTASILEYQEPLLEIDSLKIVAAVEGRGDTS